MILYSGLKCIVSTILGKSPGVDALSRATVSVSVSHCKPGQHLGTSLRRSRHSSAIDRNSLDKTVRSERNASYRFPIASFEGAPIQYGMDNVMRAAALLNTDPDCLAHSLMLLCLRSADIRTASSGIIPIAVIKFSSPIRTRSGIFLARPRASIMLTDAKRVDRTTAGDPTPSSSIMPLRSPGAISLSSVLPQSTISDTLTLSSTDSGNFAGFSAPHTHVSVVGTLILNSTTHGTPVCSCCPERKRFKYLSFNAMEFLEPLAPFAVINRPFT